MRRDLALQIIAANKDRLKEYSVKSLSIFGSVARDEATDSSDIDLLVEFIENSHVGLFKFVELRDYLQEILGCPVDLATPKALRKEMKQQILQEAIRAA